MRKNLLLLVLILFSFSAIYAEVDWTLSNDGTLTISGTNMPNYDWYGAPWYGESFMIKKVIIEDGVTNIGSYAFFYYNKQRDIFCIWYASSCASWLQD